MHTFIQRFTLRILVALAFVCGAAAPAHAMVSSGINCQPTSDADWPKISYSRAWGIQNNSATASATVMCPVGMTFPVPDQDLSLQINVYDRNTSANVDCSLLATDTGGNISGTFVLNSSGGGAGSGVQPLSRTFRKPSAFMLVLLCVIPPAQGGAVSHVTSYSVPFGEARVFHGASCVPIHSGHRNRAGYFSNLGVYNSERTGPLTVVCDLTSALLFGGFVMPGLRVYDASTEGDISCTFRLSNSDGTATDPEFSAQSSGASNSEQFMGSSAFTSASQVFTAECSIPQLTLSSSPSSIHVVRRD